MRRYGEKCTSKAEVCHHAGSIILFSQLPSRRCFEKTVILALAEKCSLLTTSLNYFSDALREMCEPYVRSRSIQAPGLLLAIRNPIVAETSSRIAFITAVQK